MESNNLFKSADILLSFSKFMAGLIFGTSALITAALSMKAVVISQFHLYAIVLLLFGALSCSLIIAFNATIALYKNHRDRLKYTDKALLGSVTFYLMGVLIATLPNL